jgi:hypothetical protein
MNFDRFSGMATAVGLVLILLIVTWLGLWGPITTADRGMSWTDIGELIKVFGAIATGAAAVTGAFVAWRGLEKWRAETLGKKKHELAAAVLANFYEAHKIIQASRNPFVLIQEMGKVDGVDEEITSNSSYAPERRLLEHQEFFARLRSKRKMPLRLSWIRSSPKLRRSAGPLSRHNRKQHRALVLEATLLQSSPHICTLCLQQFAGIMWA